MPVRGVCVCVGCWLAGLSGCEGASCGLGAERERDGRDRLREKREECQESRGKLALTICVFFCLCSDSSSSKVTFTTQGFQSEEYV